MDDARLILLLQLATTLPMTGLIWFVQVSHYPLFAAVDAASFGNYESRHRMRTSLVVGPLMLVEAATTVLLFGGVPSLLSLAEAVAGAALLLTIWGSTAGLQVPCHHRLSQGFDERAWRRLVWSNWIRTAAWTSRTALLLGVVWRQLEGMR
jgi:hypothetical protein